MLLVVFDNTIGKISLLDILHLSLLYTLLFALDTALLLVWYACHATRSARNDGAITAHASHCGVVVITEMSLVIVAIGDGLTLSTLLGCGVACDVLAEILVQ